LASLFVDMGLYLESVWIVICLVKPIFKYWCQWGHQWSVQIEGANHKQLSVIYAVSPCAFEPVSE